MLGTCLTRRIERRLTRFMRRVTLPLGAIAQRVALFQPTPNHVSIAHGPEFPCAKKIGFDVVRVRSTQPALSWMCSVDRIMCWVKNPTKIIFDISLA